MTIDYAKLIRRGLSLLDLNRTRQHLAFRTLRDEFYRDLWRKAALSMGFTHEYLGSGYNLVSKGAFSTSVKHGDVPLDTEETLRRMGNKPLIYQLMTERGYRVPRFCTYRLENMTEAERFLHNMSGSVVVKPASGTGGGRGVTTGIGDVQALRQASRFASRFGGNLLIEEQLEGRSFRLLYLNGELIDAVRRDPPVVTGDGRSTITQLIKTENIRRRECRPATSLNPLFIDGDCRMYLASIGKNVDSRPATGEVVQVKSVVNENAAAQQHSVLNLVHASTVKSGARLVREMGVVFAGIDVHCRNISRPLDEANGLITEINTTPGIHHHYLISDTSQQVPAAEIVLAYMFKSRSGVSRSIPGEYLDINQGLMNPCML